MARWRWASVLRTQRESVHTYRAQDMTRSARSQSETHAHSTPLTAALTLCAWLVHTGRAKARSCCQVATEVRSALSLARSLLVRNAGNFLWRQGHQHLVAGDQGGGLDLDTVQNAAFQRMLMAKENSHECDAEAMKDLIGELAAGRRAWKRHSACAFLALVTGTDLAWHACSAAKDPKRLADEAARELQSVLANAGG